MKQHLRFSLAIGVWVLGFTSLAGPPSIDSVLPRGGMRGEEVLIMMEGSRLRNPLGLTWYKEGIEGIRISPVNDEGSKVVAHVRITPGCSVGEHAFRIRTSGGYSDIRTFYVGPFPSVTEQEPNNEFDAPQVIAANWTIAGRVESEDVDYFRIYASKGEVLSAEIEAMRLGGVMFDPYLSLLDSNRFELAVSDDTPLLGQDGFVSIIVPEDGEYIVEVRETAYRGGGDNLYRLHVGGFPRPTAVYPAGGFPGETMDMTFIPRVGETIACTVELPESAGDHFLAIPGPMPPPSPNAIRVQAYASVLENEPNNQWTNATVYAGEAPVAFNGIINTEGDVDWFSFDAKQGQNLMAHIYARRLHTSLDSVIAIKGPGGDNIQQNDDANGLDSGIAFVAPSDGQYSIHVRDKLSKGRKDFVYRLEITFEEPSFSISLPSFDQRHPQYRHKVNVSRGNSFALPFMINRKGMSGMVALHAEGLPHGVVLESPTMDFSSDQVPVLFRAAAEAPLSGALVDLVGTWQQEGETLLGHYRQSEVLIKGNPNNHAWHTLSVNRLAVAVVDEAPFTISLESPDIPLIQGGAADLKVVIDRHHDFRGDVEITLLYRPDGISGHAEQMVRDGATETTYRLNADNNLSPRTYPMAVVGHSGSHWVASSFADVEVITPYLGGSIDMAAVEQGKEAEIVCRLNHQKPFVGEARVVLHGLPPKTTADPISITATNGFAVFPIHLEADAPIGKHNKLYCMADIPYEEHTIANSVGAFGTLRIDPPRPGEPEVVPEPDPTPVLETENPEPEERLSRLDQLRKQKNEKDEAMTLEDSL